MKDDMKALLTVQERDLDLDRLQIEINAIPKKISDLRKAIDEAKRALEEAKKEATQLQLIKKQKELDLDAQESAVRKHSTELNAVKTNEAYKALLGEIEKAKQGKSALEDQILQIMEQIDVATKAWKDREAVHKGNEAGLMQQIAEWEAKDRELKSALADKQAARQQLAESLPKALSAQYETIRKGKRGAAIVPIRKEQCTGCHMKVSQNLINEIRRAQKMMACESCSRIVYLEEVPAA